MGAKCPFNYETSENATNDIQKHLSIYPLLSTTSYSSGVGVLEGKAGTRSSETSSDEVDDNNPLFEVYNSLVTRDRGDLI